MKGLLQAPRISESSIKSCHPCLQKNLEGMVRIMKAELDPRQFYEAADVFVMNSVCENFARVVLEAMAMHLPVLGTSCGGTVEQVGMHLYTYTHLCSMQQEAASLCIVVADTGFYSKHIHLFCSCIR